MKNNRNNYIGKMRKGFKQKLSLLMIACLLFTGFHGLTISGRAETPQKEQNNEIEVNGSQVKVQLLGEDLRRAATEAILKGEKLGKSNLLSYSKDQDLATEFEEYFDGEKEIYPIPLNSISENLEESLAEEEAGLQIYVERDAKNLERLVRRESKESLLLYSEESAVAKLLPRAEEKTSVEKEEKASDSELIRDTELTGSELITFVYENKSEQKMTFQLSVDGNRYPKVSVAPKASLFKQFLSDAKKAQAEAKKNEGKEEKKEQASVSATEESKVEEKEAAAELKASGEAKQEESKEASDVELVSTAAEEHKEETQSVEAKEEKPESTEVKKEETVAESEAEKAEASVESTQAEEKQSESKAKESKTEDKSLLKEITENSEEFLPELQSVRFTQYSLNELGRKSQNVEIEGFGNVQVFYEEAAFEDKDVVLEAKRLFKREEEVEGEKLTEEQENILKEKSLYEDSASLDIRFVDKKDSSVEVEPKSPVSVRITIEKKALPEEAKAENISIHHIVEEEGSERPISVETVSRSDSEKKIEKNLLEEETVNAEEIEENTTASKEDKELSDKISKEFTVNSFSAYVVNWKGINSSSRQVRFHFVDQDYKEISPTIYTTENWNKPSEIEFKWNGASKVTKEKITIKNNQRERISGIIINPNYFNELRKLHKEFPYLELVGVYGVDDNFAWKDDETLRNEDYYSWKQYNRRRFEKKVLKITSTGVSFEGEGAERSFANDQYHDFYFVYKECPAWAYRDGEYKDPNIVKDKYITKNDDGTYDLTLTVKTKKQNKDKIYKNDKPLDVMFIYDNTGNISNEDAETIKGNISNLMQKLTPEVPSNNSDGENKTRFALITMDSEEAAKYAVNQLRPYNQEDYQNTKLGLKNEAAKQGHPVDGTLGDIKNNSNNSPSLNLNNDQKYDDSRFNIAFTHEQDRIINKLDQAIKAPKSSTGPNYYAAIRYANALFNYDRYGNNANVRYENPNLIERINAFTTSQGAKRIVIFISGSDPSRTYVQNDGTYEDYINEGGKYYLTRGKYTKGQSIGNGKSIYYPALNDARRELSELNTIDGFFAIGVGDKSKWQHLNELAIGQFADEFGENYFLSENEDLLYTRNRILNWGIKYKLFDGSTNNNLNKSFEDLYLWITERQIRDIEIEDTLSENVELTENSNSVKAEIVKLKADNVLEDHVLTESEMRQLGLKSLSVEKYRDANGKFNRFKLTTNPEHFALTQGYEIRLVANVKPTQTAYAKWNDTTKRDEGGERSDLIAIYKQDGIPTSVIDRLNPEKYGTSARQPGLCTNDSATLKYKYNIYGGKCSKCQEKMITEYYKCPIIKLDKKKETGFLRVYKGFVGFGDKLYDKDKQEWTILGKDVLKKVSFDIFMKKNGREELITTVKLGDQRWIDSKFDSTKTFKLESGYNLKIHPVETGVPDARNDEPIYTGHRFVFEINDLPKGQEYKVVEKIEDKTVEELKGKHETYTVDSYTYKYIGNELQRKRDATEKFNLMPKDISSNPGGNTYVFNNFYELTEKNIKIKVRKEVQELAGIPLSNEAKTQSFDFYLALYEDEIIKRDGEDVEVRKSYTKEKLEKVVKDLNPTVTYLNDSGKPVPVEVIEVENIQTKEGGGVQSDALEKTHHAIHFKLKHNEEISFTLKKGMKYRVYEKKTDGYGRPTYTRKVLSEDTGKIITKQKDVLANDSVYYTCTAYKIVEEETITWKNPKNLPIPTGIVRDITPYLFGIFGFVAMAGAYFAINKKRREA